ncbi:MAG: CHASE2 domain-containing protein, partial [Hyphomicrobiales bacterium]|nr:CHASE2 domain-containing protein [Hyphomicrobiales bacterium]
MVTFGRAKIPRVRGAPPRPGPGALRVALAASAIGVSALAGLAPRVVGADRLSDALRDMRFSVDDRAPTGRVVLVDIDQKSVRSVGVWPWPRSVEAKLVDRLRAAGAAAIGFDVDFSSASNPSDDAEFEAALRRSGGSVTLATEMQ